MSHPVWYSIKKELNRKNKLGEKASSSSFPVPCTALEFGDNKQVPAMWLCRMFEVIFIVKYFPLLIGVKSYESWQATLQHL